MIRSRRAEVVREQRQKVADEPAYQAPKPEAVARRTELPELSELQKRLYEVLTEEPRPVDDIISEAGLKPYQALASMTELELLGLATAHPGRRYSKAD